MDIPPDYSLRVKELRGRLGLTQVQMAEKVGVSFATVNRWENGQSRPSPLAWDQIQKLERGEPSAPSEQRDFLTDGSVQMDIRTCSAVDFSANPELVRLVVEGQRLGYGHLYNPSFATETSLIDPLPHQRIAVYEHMLKQPRLRFLLADDAGAGKTIMTGLYVREMLARRLIRRVLIAPPAGLVGNWERELRSLFSLPFRVVSGADAKSANPFVDPESDLCIVSLDTLAGERMFSRLGEPETAPFDLVVFDEAHKLSARREPDFRVRKTDRYRLAEAIAGVHTDDLRWKLGWSCQNLLLLTATPHMGKDFPYFCLWRLLEPNVLSTFDAFSEYPPDGRGRHFIRRTKEEMVHLDGSPLYPTRFSDTLSYDLTQGEISEQRLYDEMTSYIRTFYNRAKILNRSAARLAMSVFQRRLASSTYAVMRSLERRMDRIDRFIDDIVSGRLSIDQLAAMQRKLKVIDVLDEMTADEEDPTDGQEQNEAAEDRILSGVVATSLAELQAERNEVQRLLELAKKVYELGEESKFEKLREILSGPQYRNEKFIVFTEHRDTLEFLVRRLEGMGFTGQVAQIHGGIHYRGRDQQIEFFRRKADDGGARYLVATDAAGEGVNLQFCWLMVNYDIPWNPARLEQRMGRIHRYGQKHDPVVILNLIAGSTREGRVLRTLLEKLERIRKELGSDKVFDVIGRLFEGVSIKHYVELALSEEGAETAQREIEGRLTKEQVEALREREQRVYGDGGDVKGALPRLRSDMEQETYLRLLPGYVQRLLETACPRLHIEVRGTPNGFFFFEQTEPAALDWLLPVLELYPPDRRNRLTTSKPENRDEAIWLHPGEPVFDRFRSYVCSAFGGDALRGAVFIDPTASRPYMFHVAIVTVVRKANRELKALSQEEVFQCRLVGLRQEEGGRIELCPVEQLLLLKGCQGLPATGRALAATAKRSCDLADAFMLEGVARKLAQERRQALLETLPNREEFLRRGFDYQDAELAAARAQMAEKVRAGDGRAKAELTRIKADQHQLADRREEALTVIRREPEIIAPGDITFVAHALIVPSSDPEDKRRYDREIENTAVRVACSHEEAAGATVRDVSTPKGAIAAGLTEHPGFDLLSRRPIGEELAIEVKGRASIGNVELTENEWAKACNLRDKYWLYVVYECASPDPRLLRVQDPFAKLLVKARGGVIIEENEILQASDPG